MHTIPKLAIAVTFFYKHSRLPLLDTISAPFKTLAADTHLYVITNTHSAAEKEAIRTVLQNKDVPFSIHTPKLLGHPYLLTWCHFAIFEELLLKDTSITHYMYLEDDMLITKENIEYWLRGREELKPHGLIPSFLRYEKREGDDSLYMTDFVNQVRFDATPKVQIREDYCYLNMPFAYQGMYLLDSPLMAAHMRSPSWTPDAPFWGGIRAKATQGVTFSDIPAGFTSRNLAGFNTRTFTPDPHCLIHHTANNYVDVPDTPLAKTPSHALVI